MSNVVQDALEQLRAASEHLRATYPDIEADDELWQSSLESMTDATELAGWLAERCLHLAALENAAKERAAALAARAKRFAADQERLRDVILSLIDAAGGKKMTLATVTLSPRTIPPKVVATDEAATPADYLLTVTTTKPDRKAIRDALEIGAQVDGWYLQNSTRTLALLVK
jgi:hypothetical protein